MFDAPAIAPSRPPAARAALPLLFAEREQDAALVEGLIDRAFGPGRFAKTAEHNWALLARLDVLRELGRPVLIGASRKSFLGRLLADQSGEPRPVDAREAATFLSFIFNPATCRAVLPLLDELPRFAPGREGEGKAEFIESPAQVRRIGLLLKGSEIKRNSRETNSS